MGARGPVPKRSEHSRSHRSKEQLASIDRPAVPAVVVVQPAADESWHSLAADWYRSLAESGQAVYYQASDWQTARVWAEVLSRQLAGRLSAQMVAAWASAAGELLTTEGARRRARIELQRAEVDADEEASVTALDSYRADIGA